MVTLLSVVLEKPEASTITWYWPGGKSRNWYSPSTFSFCVRSKFLASLRTVTVAFFKTAPFGSFTDTCNSADADCASELSGSSVQTVNTQRYLHIPFILVP